MKVIIIKKWADFKGNRGICIAWFLYHISIFCLVIINFTFFFCHFSDYSFTPTDTSTLMLTFVGFLFAFAGINIYSIFNTNLEAEKHSLKQLRDEYEKKLSETLETIEFSKSLVRIQVLTQLIVEPQMADYQFLENIESAKRHLENAKDYILCHRGQPFYEPNGNQEIELKTLASGIKSQLSLLMERIGSSGGRYYSKFSDNESRKQASSTLQQFYDIVKSFEDGTIFNEETSENTETIKIPSFKERVKTALKAFYRIFKP